MKKKIYIGKIFEQGLTRPFTFICLKYDELLILMTDKLKERLEFGTVTFEIKTTFGEPHEVLAALEKETYGK